MLASSRKPTHQCTRAFGDGFHNGAVATCSQITDGTKINNPVHNTAKNMLAKKKHLWMKMSESGGQKQTRMLANSCNLQTTALGERERSSRNVTVYLAQEDAPPQGSERDTEAPQASPRTLRPAKSIVSDACGRPRTDVTKPQ